MARYKLSEIAHSTKGKKPKTLSKEKTIGFAIPYVDIKAFEKGIIDNYTDGENCTFCTPDDVLIVWDGARCGFVGRGIEGAIGSTLAKISSEKYTNDFLFYFLQSKYKVLNSNPRGVGIPHIEPNLLWNFEIPDIDKTTQHQIVSRIESLFAELDMAVEHLRTAQQQLKIYRQAVLNHWLNNEDGKWETVKLGEICSVLGDGLHGTPKFVENGDFYFINGNNLNGAIVIKQDTKTTNLEEFEKYKKNLNERTILISINGTLGNIAYYNGEPVVLGKSACYFNLLDGIEKDYVKYCLLSERFRSYALKNATGSTIKNVPLKAMRMYSLPLPPLSEQQRIVKEIETRLSQAEAAEARIAESLQKTEALRQSILKKAFSGELV